MKTINITINNGSPQSFKAGTPLRNIIPENGTNGLPVIGALVNNDVRALNSSQIVNANITPLTAADAHGWDIYRRSLSLLLAKAAHEVLPEKMCRVHHSYGAGLFCTFTNGNAKPNGARKDDIAKLKATMARLVAEDRPITSECVNYDEAVEMLRTTGQTDKLNLLLHRNPPVVTLIRCGDFLDLTQAPLVHRTGVLKTFDLIPFDPGFILHMPSREEPLKLGPLPTLPKLFNIYQEHVEWGRILGLTTVGQLNETIVNHQIDEFIRTAEALHEKKLAAIAAEIAARRAEVRLILVAGPSSAGKTTFAKRLVTHLRVNGMQPIMVSTDNYFVGDERNPRDEDGNLDYEHIEAMDIERLNADLLALLAGKAVHLPVFNFKTKSSSDEPLATQLPPNGVLLMEGIHCLNPRLTAAVAPSFKFRIFVSALTQLGIDHSSRISTTDNRLLRRIVRDNEHRGHTALTTLQRWPSVRRGEQRWIFPFQEDADAIFNSALDYELAVIKPFVASLLNEVKPHHPEYAEARRLTGFLHNFMAVHPTAVPGHSILREYIGGSQLPY